MGLLDSGTSPSCDVGRFLFLPRESANLQRIREGLTV